MKISPVVVSYYLTLPDTNNNVNLVHNKEIKAVAISTPDATHAKFVKQSILTGKNVFVEKLLALATEDVQKLVELAP